MDLEENQVVVAQKSDAPGNEENPTYITISNFSEDIVQLVRGSAGQVSSQMIF